jgi:mono/diheme cytochrome c family protein
MNIHRGVGFAYAILYLILMIEMVPRLWTYQVELPPRTVAHLMLGVSIGVLLIIKISILRFFRHFEEWMPALGVAILLCTVLLIVLSVPFVIKERALAANDAFTAENRSRVQTLLGGAGLPEDADIAELSSEPGLRRGRQLLLSDCVYCHDLRTAISRPRTPKDWFRTVERMRAKPSLGPRIEAEESQLVTAYLVAITPQLQDSATVQREISMEQAQSKKAAAEVLTEDEPPPAPTGDVGAPGSTAGPPVKEPAEEKPPVKKPAVKKPAVKKPPVKEPPAKEPPAKEPPAKEPPVKKPPDLARAKAVYEEQCSQCHELSDVDAAPPKTAAETDELIQRMIDNGMEIGVANIELIRVYMNATFVDK